MALWLRHPPFGRLLLASVLSMLGDWLTYVAVGVLALQGPRGAWDVALVQFAHTLPLVVAAPTAGWLADRVDRVRLALGASLVRGGLTLAMAYAAHRGELGALELLLFLRMAGAPFVSAPTTALVPALVPRSELQRAHALLGMAWAGVFTLGVALGGLVSMVVGPTLALALDSLTFVLAALVLRGVSAPTLDPGTPARIHARHALARPPWALAALKVPAQLASGAAFVALHGCAALLAPTRTALALGGLHALRGASNAIAATRIRAAPDALRTAALGSMLCIGAALLLGATLWCAASEPASWVAWAWAVGAMIAWGAGSALSWVGASAALQQAAPSSRLGRFTALDLSLAALASATGALACASGGFAIERLAGADAILFAALLAAASAWALHRVLCARVALILLLLGTAPSVASAQSALWDALDARALRDDDFARGELWSWTGESQARALTEDHRLLRSGPGDGAARSPYQRALDELAESETADADEVALARALTDDPRVRARRYAWTTPYGAVLPLGARSYGAVLIRIELRADAWHARFAPGESPAFRVADGAGRVQTVAALLADPTRLGSVVHVRHEGRPHAYREIVVHGAVARWSIGGAEVDARIQADLRVLRALQRVIPVRAAARPLARDWRAGAPTGTLARFAATMPFDTPRHRATPAALCAIEAALRARVTAQRHLLAVDVEPE